MYWTIPMPDSDVLRIRNPIVFVENTIYSFGFFLQNEFKNRGPSPMDVYMLKTENYKLSLLPPQDSTPLQRFGHSAVVYGKKVYMWGGEDFQTMFLELICFDTETYSWSMPKTTGIPPEDGAHYSSFVIGKVMYMLGGYYEHGEEVCQDIITLNLETMNWGKLLVAGGPEFKFGSRMCAIGHTIYVFDSDYFVTSWNKVSCLDIQTGDWTHSNVAGAYPQLMFGAMFQHQDNIYVFGGRCEHLKIDTNDMWRFSTKDRRWQLVKPAGVIPRPQHESTYIMCGDKLFLLGGSNNSQESSVKNLHILDFSPSLRTLCLMAVITYGLDFGTLPKSLKLDLDCMSGISGLKFDGLHA